MDFSQFEKDIDFDSLQKDIDDVKKNSGTGDYAEVSKGTYTVQLVKMEVGTCGAKAKIPNAPLLKADFKIIDGEFKNSHLFVNKVLYTDRNDNNWNMAKLLANVIGWVESLEPSENVGDIVFENYEQFSDLILDVAEDVSELEYQVKYDKDAFNAVSIEDVFE